MSTATTSKSPTESVITPKRHILDVDIMEIWKFRDLIYLFVKRDFVTIYKQTILGPLWFFIKPIFTTLIFTFVFGRVGGFAPDDKPVFLYYLCGIILWQYFADCLRSTSETFRANARIFGKVYFPRLVIPISLTISNLLKLGIQLLLFIFFYVYYVLFRGYTPELNATIFLLPVLVFMMAFIGMGLGLIITSLTTKYRDFQFLIDFGISLLMYVTPGIIMSYRDFNTSLANYSWFIKVNPLGHIIETFKYGALDAGYYDPIHLAYSGVFIIIVMFAGIIIFNRTEQNFMDTV